MSGPIRRSSAITALAVSLLLVACGSSPSSSAADGETDADQPIASESASTAASESASEAASAAGLCGLVPIEEVETALGMSTDGGVGDESFLTGGETCRFTGDEDHVLDVEMSEQTREEWLEAIETVGLNDEPVEGVGEEAYRAAETALGGPGARFTAWADGREVGVTIYSDADQAVTFAAAQAIAEALLAAGS